MTDFYGDLTEDFSFRKSFAMQNAMAVAVGKVAENEVKLEAGRLKVVERDISEFGLAVRED